VPRRNDPPATEPAITIPHEDGTPSDAGSASVPRERRGPVPPLADERRPADVPPPVMGKPDRDERGSIVRSEVPELDQAKGVARAVSTIVIDVLGRHGVSVPAAAHADMLTALADFVRPHR
jgi:hypothetical protein